MSSVYALGADDLERKRLLQQAEELRSHSEALLDHVGVERGWRVIDLGCGPLGIVDVLSERVGPKGSVVGLDYDPVSVALACEFTSEHRLQNVEIVKGDARHTGLPDSSFDLVHARTLLINLQRPDEVVAEMKRLAKPGKWVAAMEPEATLTICYPSIPAWERMQDIFAGSYRAQGVDLLLGRKLFRLLWDAGLMDIGVEPRAEAYPSGHSRRMVRPDLLRSMRSKVIASGLATDQELIEIDHEVRAHLEEPQTLLTQMFFMAWGRKPLAT